MNQITITLRQILEAGEWVEDEEAGRALNKLCCRLEALLRNRQELIELIEVIQELNEAEILDADKIDELYAKAKELDND